MNDYEGDNCKLRRRKLLFDSEGEKGKFILFLKFKCGIGGYLLFLFKCLLCF